MNDAHKYPNPPPVTLPPPHTNMPTNGQTPLPAVDLPDHRQKQVEAGLATYQSVLTERDQLQSALRDMHIRNDSLNNQLNSLRGVITMMEESYKKSLDMLEQRVASAVKGRDEMADRAISLETIIAGIYAQLRQVIVGEKRNSSGSAPPTNTGC